jgi:hypothetical protein
MSTRAERRRREKARTGTKLVNVGTPGRIIYVAANNARREKKEICRMFGISGKRYRALEKKDRRERAR